MLRIICKMACQSRVTRLCTNQQIHKQKLFITQLQRVIPVVPHGTSKAHLVVVLLTIHSHVLPP